MLTYATSTDRPYVHQQFLPKVVFNHVCHYLKTKEILTVNQTCRQLHDWIWETQPAIQVIENAILWTRCSQAFRQKVLLPSPPIVKPTKTKFSPLAALPIIKKLGSPIIHVLDSDKKKHDIDLSRVLATCEYTNGRAWRSQTVIASGSIHWEIQEKIEAEAKSVHSNATSDKPAFFTVTSKGLVTIWRKLTDYTVSTKDVLQHINVTPNNLSTLRNITDVFIFNHLFIANGEIGHAADGNISFMVTRDLKRYSEEDKDFLPAEFLDLSPSQDCQMPKDAMHQKCWKGHTPNTLFVANNKPSPSFSAYVFDKETNTLKRLWHSDQFRKDDTINFYTSLLSNDEIVAVPLNTKLHKDLDQIPEPFEYIDAQVIAILDAKSGKVLHRHTLTFTQQDTAWSSLRWLYGNVLAYQLAQDSLLRIIWRNGSVIPPIKVKGVVRNITATITKSTEKQPIYVKTQKNIFLETRDVTQTVLKLTIEFRRKSWGSLKTYQLVLESNRPKPLPFFKRLFVKEPTTKKTAII